MWASVWPSSGQGTRADWETPHGVRALRGESAVSLRQGAYTQLSKARKIRARCGFVSACAFCFLPQVSPPFGGALTHTHPSCDEHGALHAIESVLDCVDCSISVRPI